MRESIFFSGMRAFFITVCAMVGLAVGIMLLTLLVSLSSSGHVTEPEQRYTKEVVPNAEGERTVLAKDTPVILKLNVEGIIGTEELSTQSIQRQLIESREGDLKDNRVKGILLHINSPGGTVVDADGIYRAIKAYKEKFQVPVYAYVDGLCASGGMYVACAADRILSSEISMVGSIGVLSPSFMNFHKLLDSIGVSSLTLTAGKDKDILNPLREWKENEQEPIQNLINYYYNIFVDIVANNRPKLDKQKLVDVYGANVFNAVQAMDYGLVDSASANYSSALKELLEKVGIADNNYQVIEMSHKSWWSEFMSKSSILSGQVVHKIQLSPEMDPQLTGKFLYLYRPE